MPKAPVSPASADMQQPLQPPHPALAAQHAMREVRGVQEAGRQYLGCCFGLPGCRGYSRSPQPQGCHATEQPRHSAAQQQGAATGCEACEGGWRAAQEGVAEGQQGQPSQAAASRPQQQQQQWCRLLPPLLLPVPPPQPPQEPAAALLLPARGGGGLPPRNSGGAMAQVGVQRGLQATRYPPSTGEMCRACRAAGQ
jgi:hypothetical protein